MENWKSRSNLIGYVVAGAFGWAISHALDLFKFGAIGLWSKLLAVLTLGSATVRDAPYAMAATNPYPVPSLFSGFMWSALPLLFLTYIVMKIIHRRSTGKQQNELEYAASDEERLHLIIKRERVKSQTLVVLLPILLVLTIASLVPIGIINQGVAVRRIYEADRDIVSPFLSPEQRVQLQADFCGVNTKAEYLKLMRHIQDVATEHHAKLRSEGY